MESFPPVARGAFEGDKKKNQLLHLCNINQEHSVWVGTGGANAVRVTVDREQWATCAALPTLKHNAANECASPSLCPKVHL